MMDSIFCLLIESMDTVEYIEEQRKPRPAFSQDAATENKVHVWHMY